MSRFPNIRLSYFQDLSKIKRLEQNSYFQQKKIKDNQIYLGLKKSSIQSEQQSKKY